MLKSISYVFRIRGECGENRTHGPVLERTESFPKRMGNGWRVNRNRGTFPRRNRPTCRRGGVTYGVLPSPRNTTVAWDWPELLATASFLLIGYHAQLVGGMERNHFFSSASFPAVRVEDVGKAEYRMLP